MHRLLLIEVANWKVVAALVTAAVLLFATATIRRRHWLALGGAALAIGSLAAADAVNTYYGYLPQLADVAGVADWRVIPPSDVLSATSGSDAPALVPVDVLRHGGVVALPVNGLRSGFGRHRVLVYLPSAYFTSPELRFPVVYLLHGSPGRPEDWLRAGRLPQLLATGQTLPFIFVMAPMSRGWLDDSECVDSRHEHVETWLVDDVVPRIDGVLRTVADRGHRALAGMSAGGYCALNLALRDSSVFGSALDMSGYIEPTHDGGLIRLFGPGWRQAAAENTPARYLATHQVTLPLQLRFDVGRGDSRPLRETESLLPLLRREHIDATMVTREGSHTYHVWVPALRDGLRWLLRTVVDGGGPNLPLSPRVTEGALCSSAERHRLWKWPICSHSSASSPRCC